MMWISRGGMVQAKRRAQRCWSKDELGKFQLSKGAGVAEAEGKMGLPRWPSLNQILTSKNGEFPLWCNGIGSVSAALGFGFEPHPCRVGTVGTVG